MGESMKGLNYGTRSCIKQDLIVSRLKMQPDYSPYSINQKVQFQLNLDKSFLLAFKSRLFKKGGLYE
jgi:hypothetical protein